MVILDKKSDNPEDGGIEIPEPAVEAQVAPEEVVEKPAKKKKKVEEKKVEEPSEEDIPF
jgi:hypothetical protein